MDTKKEDKILQRVAQTLIVASTGEEDDYLNVEVVDGVVIFSVWNTDTDKYEDYTITVVED